LEYCELDIWDFFEDEELLGDESGPMFELCEIFSSKFLF